MIQCTSSVSRSFQDHLESAESEMSTLKKQMLDEYKVAAKLEKKLTLHTNGFFVCHFFRFVSHNSNNFLS